MVSLGLGGCGFVEGGEPVVVAHRAAAGNWPENSRTAVTESLNAGYPAIEVDIAITSDDVPILAHEPWINQVTCETVDGDPVDERLLIQDFTLQELHDGFRCGGRRDPDQPDAELVADTYMPLDELLEALDGVPEVLVYLDTKYDPRFTQSAEVFAEEIVSRLDAAALPNRFVIESTLPEGVQALNARGSYTAALGWPRYAADDDGVGTTLAKEFSTAFGVESGVGQAIDSGARAITSPYQLADRQQAQLARDADLELFLFTLNDESTLGTFCDWPADFVMTDYPERAPCLR